MYRMYDASVPPKNPPPWEVVAFYFGSDTPHDWSVAELDAQPAQKALPITPYTGADISGAAMQKWQEFQTFKEKFGFPDGMTWCIDTETEVYKIFLSELNTLSTQGGHPLLHYGSLDFIIECPLTSGGRFVADWDKVPKLLNVPGIKALQFESATQAGTDYDLDIIEEVVKLWEFHPVGVKWSTAVKADLASIIHLAQEAQKLMIANT